MLLFVSLLFRASFVFIALLLLNQLLNYSCRKSGHVKLVTQLLVQNIH